MSVFSADSSADPSSSPHAGGLSGSGASCCPAEQDPFADTAPQDREQLRRYILDLAVHRGQFTLSSGQQASFYVDLRQVSLDYRVAPLIGRVLLRLITPVVVQRNVYGVGGLTLGADPVASAVMHASCGTPHPLHAFVVRKQVKEHGRGRRIEGPELRGRSVVVVEDTSTTGGSPLTAVAAVEEAGAQVAAVAVVVDRDTGARERIEEAGYPYLAAFNLADLGLA